MSEIQIITDETRTRLNALAIEVTGELLRAGLPAYSSMTSEPGAHVTVDSLEPRGVTIDWHCHDGLLTPMFEATADNIIADDLPGPNPSADWVKAISRTMETSITTILTAAGWSVSALDDHELLVESPVQVDGATAPFQGPSAAREAAAKLESLALRVQDELAFAGLPIVPSASEAAPAEAIGAQIFVDPGESTGVLVAWLAPNASEPTRRTVLASIAEILAAADWPVTEHDSNHLLVGSKGELSPWHLWHRDQSERRGQRWRDVVNARHRQECALPEHDRDGETSG